MALDKLVDSTQLDSDLGDVADAIRAKSGGSSPLAFPTGFVSEIGNIQTGGGIARGLSQIHAYNYLGTDNAEISFPVTFPDLSTLTFSLGTSSTKYSLDITAGTNEISCGIFTNGNTNRMYIKKLILHGAKLNFSYQYGIRYWGEVTEIDAKCRFTGSLIQLTGCKKLEKIDFQENMQSLSINFSPCPLNNQSLINLANGLSEDVTGNTLTLSSSQKTTTDGIIGRIEEITTADSTYNKFIEDVNGTVTLTNFITQTKGWTVA